MITREKLDPTSLDLLDSPRKCPHCGAELLSRHAIRQHLTLKVCQGGSGELGEDSGIAYPTRQPRRLPDDLEDIIEQDPAPMDWDGAPEGFSKPRKPLRR